MTEQFNDEIMEGGIYTLTDEDGNEEQFELLGTCEIDGAVYYALAPENEEADEYVILKAEKDEDGELMLVTIEDDDEFDRVADYFDAHLEEIIDFDEVASDDAE